MLLCDASGRVLLRLPEEPKHAAARKLLVEASRSEGSVVVRGLEIVTHERTVRVRLTDGGSVASMEGMAIGYMAPLLSEHVFEEEGEEEGAEPVGLM